MKTSRGFTLLEVMIGLALLGLALTVLIKSASMSIFASQEAHMMGVVTELSRGKIYDIEEKLLKDGYQDTEQHEDNQAFTDEGWPEIHYDYKVQPVELPSFDTLQAMAKGQAQAAGSVAMAKASGSGSGSSFGSASADGALGGFGNSALGGMLMQFGGFGGGSGGGDLNDARGASLISSQYSMFQDILKVAIRKVTLTMRWKVLGRDRDLTVVTYFTDQSAMDKVLKGFGSTELPDDTGSGSGSNKSTSSSTKTPTKTTK